MISAEDARKLYANEQDIQQKVDELLHVLDRKIKNEAERGSRCAYVHHGNMIVISKVYDKVVELGYEAITKPSDETGWPVLVVKW